MSQVDYIGSFCGALTVKNHNGTATHVLLDQSLPFIRDFTSL